MKILIQNLRGINTKSKRRQALQNARSKVGNTYKGPYDIILYQEVRLQQHKLDLIKNEWGQRGNVQRVFLSGTEDNALRGGVLTLIRNQMEIKNLDQRIVQGHAIINVFKHNEKIWLVGNIYGNPKSEDHLSNETMLEISRQIEDIQTNFHPDHIILAGDWNCVLQNKDTTTRVRKNLTELTLTRIIENYNLIDIFQHKTPHPVLTWTSDADPTRKARHDRIYVSPNLIHSSEVKANMSTSDHMAIHGHFLKTKRGMPEWKFDDNILTNSDFTEGLNHVIRDSLLEHTERGHQQDASQIKTNELQKQLNYIDNPPIFILQAIVAKVTEFSKKFMKIRKTKLAEYNDRLHNTFLETKAQLHLHPNSEHWRDKMTEITIELNNERQRKATEAIMRTKVRMVEEGDKPTAYFLSLAQSKSTNRDINSISIDLNGTRQRLEGTEIVEHMTNRYKNIIKEDNPPQITLGEFMGTNINKIKKVPDKFIPTLKSKFSEQELSYIVENMKNQSAPGPSGITNRFLKYIFPYISKLATDVGNELMNGHDIGNIPEWITIRNIIFIPKPDKPLENPDSYRGLSLLNNLYKIYAAALAKRMSLVMPHIMHPCQKGFIKGKSAAENVRGITDTLEYAHRKKIPMVILQTDYSKAFPSISKIHITEVLTAHGFPTEFINRLNTLTNTVPMKVQINGFLSELMHAQKGTGQGDPLSSHLYDLAANPLNIMLAESDIPPRPPLPNNKSITLEAYADDNCIPLSNDIQRIKNTIELIKSFKNVSGLELSTSKCKLMFTQACTPEFKTQLIQQVNMTEVQQMKYLGLTINLKGEINDTQNLEPVLEKIKDKAKSITWRHTSPLGKAIQTKALLNSKYTHILQNSTPEDDIIKKLWKETKSSIWTKHRNGNTTARVEISQDRINQPLKYGGLNIPHPNTTIKILRFIWIRRSFQQRYPDTNWSILLDILLTEINRPNMYDHLALGPNEWKHTATLLLEKHKYWAHTFKAISEILEVTHNTQPLTWHHESIAGHTHVTDLNHTFSLTIQNRFVKEMFENGLRLVGQLFKSNHMQTINTSHVKLKRELEDEFNIALTDWQYRSLIILTRDIRQKQKEAIQTDVTETKISILNLMALNNRKGCRFIKSMFDKEQRQGWEWGNVAKSFFTHNQDGLMTVTQKTFTKGYSLTNKSITVPRDRWLSIQILNRTIWTNFKQYLSESNRQNNTDNLNHLALCENCGEHDEHTDHLFVQCTLAKKIWLLIEQAMTYAIRHTNCGETNRAIHLPVKINQSNIIFMKPVTDNKLAQDTMTDLLIIGKRLIYSARMKTEILTSNILKRMISAKINTLSLIRSSLSLNFSLTKLCVEFLTPNQNY